MTHSVRAIFICLIAYLCFDLMSIHVRYLSARYSAQELSVYRNIFGILPSIVLLWYTRELSFRISTYKLVQWKLALARGFFVAVAQLLFYTALGQLELATVSALAQTNAVFVVLLAVFMFRERLAFGDGARLSPGLSARYGLFVLEQMFSLGWRYCPLGLRFVMHFLLLVCAALIARFRIRSCIYIQPSLPRLVQSSSRSSPIALVPFYRSRMPD